MVKRTVVRDLIWIVPASLGLGGVLSAFGRGTWWIGWLAYASILLLGLFALAVLWRGAGAGRTLGLVLLLALCLRLGLGLALTRLLPVYGYGSKVEVAGYVFEDAFQRDSRAWELAVSPESIWKAFDKSQSPDQYGGLLALSALVYRFLSPDAHRPGLIILISAMTAAIGVALAWKATRQLWGDTAAWPAAWILALYPESLLLGSSQMREPFLVTFITMAFWGAVAWQSRHERQAWLWLAGGFAGMLLFNPGAAIFALPGLGGWAWLQNQSRRVSWRIVLIGIGVGGVALILLWQGLAIGPFANASTAAVFSNWLQWAARWDTLVMQRNSGWVQGIFKALPQPLHLPFMTGYGITQPVFPAILVDSAPWPWKVLGILRSAGWYGLVPFLVAGLIAVWRLPEKPAQRAWIWLWAITWIWILLSSYRAGGDQWDNPRYRAIFLLWQAILAAKAWGWWRETHNPWMGRILAVEGTFLVFFTYWYLARYLAWKQGQVHVFVIMGGIVIVSGLILIGGWIGDRRRARR